eukprot:gene17717-19488_t
MKKDFHNALKDARYSTTYNSEFAKGYHREAKCHMALGACSTARKCLEKVLDIDPSNKQVQSDLRTVKAMIEFEKQAQDGEKADDHRKREYCMRRLCEYAPDCIKYKALQAEAMALQGKLDDAQIMANDILRNDMQHAEALYVRGLCLYYQDNTEKAFRTFQQLFVMDPDFKKAKDVYKKAKLLDSTKSQGNEAFKKGKYKEALDLYTKALKIDPFNKATNAKIHSNRANVNQKLNRLDEAIEDCDKAIEYDPNFLKPYVRRAKCYMDSEKYEEAVRDYEKITKMDKSPDYRQMLKNAKFELKKSKRKDYYKILNVSKTASDDEIKKAYRKEALKHHPDRHSNETEEKKKDEERLFKEVNEAYSILSDKQKRMRYDNGQDLEDNGMDFGDFDPNQIFQAFFGGGGGFSQSSSAGVSDICDTERSSQDDIFASQTRFRTPDEQEHEVHDDIDALLQGEQLESTTPTERNLTPAQKNLIKDLAKHKVTILKHQGMANHFRHLSQSGTIFPDYTQPALHLRDYKIFSSDSKWRLNTITKTFQRSVLELLSAHHDEVAANTKLLVDSRNDSITSIQESGLISDQLARKRKEFSKLLPRKNKAENYCLVQGMRLLPVAEKLRNCSSVEDGIPAVDRLDYKLYPAERKAILVRRSRSLNGSVEDSIRRDTDYEDKALPTSPKRVTFADANGQSLVEIKKFVVSDLTSYFPKPEILRPRSHSAPTMLKYFDPETSFGTLNLPCFSLKSCFHLPSHREVEERVERDNVSLENMTTDARKIRIVCKVKNISYHKTVSIRFTFDKWTSFTEAIAEHASHSWDGRTDQFQIEINVPKRANNVAFAIRYQTDSSEFWDNNNGENYIVQSST